MMAQEQRYQVRQPDLYLVPPKGDANAGFKALLQQRAERCFQSQQDLPCGVCEKQLPNLEHLVIYAVNCALKRKEIPLLCTSAVFFEGLRSNKWSTGQWHLECRFAYPHRGSIDIGESCRLSPRTMYEFRGAISGGILVDCSLKRMASHETKLLPRVPETAEAKEACSKIPAPDGWLYFERKRDYTKALLLRLDRSYCSKCQAEMDLGDF